MRKWKKVWVEEGAYPKFKWVPVNQPYPTPIPPEFLESIYISYIYYKNIDNNTKNTPMTTRRSYRLSLKDDKSGETPRDDVTEEL